MKADSWMPVYVGDYLRDTMHLTTEQHGAYLLLLFCCWFARGLLDDNDAILAGVCKATPEYWKTNLRPVLVKFFEVKDGKWISKRVAEERLKADNLCEFRRKIGSRGGSNKAANALANATPNGKTLLKQNPTPSESPSPSLERDSASTDAGIPTWTEVQTEASMRAVTPETAKSFFDHHQDNNLWINGHKVLINWRSKLRNWQVKDRVFSPKKREETPPGDWRKNLDIGSTFG